MDQHIKVITIDGPSGSGKGTICQLLASKLDWHFLDSGALYRILALAALTQRIPLDDEAQLVNCAHQLQVKFKVQHISDVPQILLDGQDVTETIRSEICGNTASKISALPLVRQALLARQRAFKQAPGLVTDGRDMGTVVFPDADLKIYLDASTEERAQRRYKQLNERGINANLATITAELKERDARDKSRSIAPLKPADDAIIINTTGLSIQEVIAKILPLAEKLAL